MHESARNAAGQNALGGKVEGFGGVFTLQATLKVPSQSAFVWDVVNDPTGIVEKLLGGLPFVDDSSWVMHASSFSAALGLNASPTTAVEPVLELHDDGNLGAGRMIRLLPERQFPTGFVLPAGADVLLTVDVAPDDLALGQTRSWPVRAFLGLDPAFDLTSVVEATVQALVAPTSANAAVFGVEAWCLDLE